MTLLQYLYISLIGLAFLSSLVSFRLDYPFHLKLFSIIIGAAFLTEILAVFVTKTFHFKTNLPVYNIFILLEFWGYGFYFYKITSRTAIKKLIQFYLYLFPVFWMFTTFFYFKLGIWNSYSIIIGSFFTICFSVGYYYQFFTSHSLINIQLRKHAEFWIATGLILFYSCQLPYVGMLNFLMTNYPGLATGLLPLLQIFNILMYSIFIYAFLCRIEKS